MASLASINVKFSTDLAEFQSGMQKAQKQIDQFSSKMRAVGAGMTAAVTAPLTLLGVEAVQTAAKFEQLKQQMKTAFQGNEELSKAAYKEVQQFASKTPYAVDEAVQSFIKLKNLGLDPSIESMESYGNTASAMGKSLDQMIEAVADAATGEFERLKEFGIKAKSEGDRVSFTFQGVTTTVGKNAKEIQDYLLKIGRVNFAGAMAAQANTFNGQIANMKDNIEQIMADFGDIMIEWIRPLNDALSEAIEWFRGLSDETKKWIVILGGIAAAIGPILMLAGTTLPLLIAGFTALAGPVGLVLAGVAAIAYAVINNWDDISAYVTELANDFIDLYNESESFRFVIQGIIFHFKNMWDVGKRILQGLLEYIMTIIDAIVENFKVLFRVADQVSKGNFVDAAKSLYSGLADNFVNSWKSVFKTIDKTVTNSWNDFNQNMKEFMVNVVAKPKLDHVSLKTDVEAVVDEVEEVVQQALDGKKGEAGNKAVSMSGISLEASGINIVEPILKWPEKLNAALPNFQASLTEWQVAMIKFSQEMGRQINQFATDMISGFAEAVAGLATGTTNMKQVLGSMLGMMADFVMRYGKMLISYGVGVVAFESSFTNPYAAIAAGAALVMLGSLMKNMMQTPKLASGGLAFGETLATIGEYRGARSNPEVIAPLDRLKKMLDLGSGNLSGEVVFRQRGTDLEGVLKRQNFVDNKIS